MEIERAIKETDVENLRKKVIINIGNADVEKVREGKNENRRQKCKSQTSHFKR